MSKFERFKIGYSTLSIHKDWKVIEIGGGANPCPRSNIITNYEQSKNQRNKKIKSIPGTKMYEVSMESMPMFTDKQFDYSIKLAISCFSFPKLPPFLGTWLWIISFCNLRIFLDMIVD